MILPPENSGAFTAFITRPSVVAVGTSPERGMHVTKNPFSEGGRQRLNR